MKKWKQICLIVFFMFLVASPGYAADEETILNLGIDQQLEKLPLDEMEQLLTSIDEDISQYMPEMSLREMLRNILNGTLSFNAQDFMQGLFQIFRHEVALSLNVIGKLIFLAVLSAVVMNLQGAFEKSSIHKIADFVILSIVIILILSSVNEVLTVGRETLTRLTNFMQVLMPIQLILLVALGSVNSVAILQPSLFLMINVISSLFTYVIFPFIYFEVVLKLVNHLSDAFKVDKLASMFKGLILSIVSISSTVFLAILSIQGIGGAVVDGVSIRTAKYMTDAFVPVVGGMLSDIMETMVGGSLLIKNSFGILGLVALILITLVPAIKLFVIYLLYKFAAALVQPLGDSKVVAIISDMANSLLLVFVAVIFVAVMFFFTIVIITTTANFAVMLR